MPVNRQSVPRAERVAAIVEAAAVEFTKAGFDDTPIAAIARRAGMTAANVHYYFESKDALVTAVAARAYELLFAELAAVPDPIERLHRYVAFHLSSHALRGQLAAIAARYPALDVVLRERERWVSESAAAVVGDPRDASVLAAVVIGLVEVAVPDPDAARRARSRRRSPRPRLRFPSDPGGHRMRLAHFSHDGRSRLGVVVDDQVNDLAASAPDLPTEPLAFLTAGRPALDAAQRGHRRRRRRGCRSPTCGCWLRSPAPASSWPWR